MQIQVSFTGVENLKILEFNLSMMREKYRILQKIQPSLELPSFKVRCKFNTIINKAYTILEPEHSQSNFITGEDLVLILIVFNL